MISAFVHLFHPHHSNNHRPHLLHPQGIAVLVAIFLFTNSSLKLLAQVRGGVLGYASSITPQSVLDELNTKRIEAGLKPLGLNDRLNQAATMKASDMFTLNYWAHNNPNGKEPWDFIKAAGYRYRYAGENLARDFGDTDSLIDAWMASPTHKDNIVNPRYQETGIAVVNGTLQGIETTLVVNLFGTPAVSLPQISGIQTPVQAQEIVTITTAAAISSPPAISPLLLEKVIAVSIISLVLLTLLWDTLHSSKLRLVRLVGKNPAHILFLLTVLLVVIFSQAGGLL
ncbi:MAG: hypothetical protein A2784_01840 [Candidatus Chisholmbacteria bacterium RIFCSPHIGHO2_01_FULL_48_12]|uniref:SCP domain-containing protein n=1 Tax=Candidatus Chisholmbacteria bacterium RIFCSPHIGHO2_01_FULL_48_12 TaxID=1797589 RepID=A0A1G1VRC3_9BACT|nr:MAG: hypothetical protein A2784_01840 [Candidatus Chisholmbacteria bacterium RIFCSPHIGHO2_01_FULL_48_12]